jgi:hypothetical protein
VNGRSGPNGNRTRVSALKARHPGCWTMEPEGQLSVISYRLSEVLSGIEIPFGHL